MQETPQDHFLNAKARFQKHYDKEDAAALLFACNNLINHGMEVEWDATLHKMDEVLKAKAKVISDEQLAEEEKDPPKPERLYEDEGPDKKKDLIRHRFGMAQEGRGRQGETGGSEYDVRGGKYSRERAETAPSRKFSTKSIPFVLTPEEIFDLESKGLRATPDALISHLMNQYATWIGEDNPRIDTIFSDRPHGTYGETGDEHSWLGIFSDNSHNPALYKLLRHYYHPRSEYFVGQTDPTIDDHDRKIITDVVGVDEDIHDTIARLDEKAKEGIPETRERFKKDINHMNPALLGPIPENFRSRLYRRAFGQWDEWYKRNYPESPLLQGPETSQRLEQRRLLFLDHKALRLDGCKLNYIKKRLYDEDGSQKENYSRIMRYEDFNDEENRDRTKAMGTRPFEYGLEMLDSDPDNFDNHEAKACIEGMGAEMSRDLGRVKDDAWNKDPEKWEEDNPLPGFDFHLGDKADDRGHAFHEFDTERRMNNGSPGFSMREMLNYMLRHQNLMTRAYHLAWTAHPNVPNASHMSATLSDDADVWKVSMERALKHAHKATPTGRVVGRGRSLAEQQKGAWKSPIFAKVRDAYIKSGGWDHDSNVPSGFDYKGPQGCDDAIQHWLGKGIINASDAAKLRDTLDWEHGGYSEQSEVFRDRRSSFARDFWHWLYALRPTLLKDIDLENHQSDDANTHETSPFFPTFSVFGEDGGLGLLPTDSMNVYLQRNSDLSRDVLPSMLELSDLEPLPNLRNPKVRQEYCGDKGFWGTWSAKDEVSNAYQRGAELEDIFEDTEGMYPRLSGMLRRFVKKFKPSVTVDSEEGLQALKDWKETNFTGSGLMARGDLDSLVKLALKDRMAAQLSYPSDNYKPYITPSNDEARLTPSGVAEGAWREHREEPVGSSGGMHGRVPLTPYGARGLFHMNDAYRTIMTLQGLPVAWGMDAELRAEKASKLPKPEFRRRHRFLETVALGRLASMVSGESDKASFISNISTYFPALFRSLLGARLKHGENTIRNEPGDGGETGNPSTRASHATHVRWKKGQAGNDMLQQDLEARLVASLWGMAGAEPLTWKGENIITSPRAFKGFLGELRSAKLTHQFDDELLDHPSPFFRGKKMSELWSLFEKPGKVAKEKDWRGALEGEEEHGAYLYPVESGEDGNYYLPLSQISEGILQPDPVPIDPTLKPTKTFSEKGGRKQEFRTPFLHAPVDPVPPERHMSFNEANKNRNISGGYLQRFNDYLLRLDPKRARRGPEMKPSQMSEEQPQRYMLDEMAEQAQKMAHSSKIKIPKECITLDTDGNAKMVASHPAELLATWVDSVYAHLPQTDSVKDARNMLYEQARDQAHMVVGGDSAPDYERDTDHDSGLKIGGLVEQMKAHHNLAMGLEKGGIVPAMLYCTTLDAKAHPEHYEGLEDLESKMKVFLGDRISMDGSTIELGSKEHHDRSVNLHRVLEVGQIYLNNVTGRRRGAIRNTILSSPDLSDEERDLWEKKLEKVDQSIRNSEATYRTRDMNYRKPEHDALASIPFSGKDGQKDVLGHRILRSFLQKDPTCREIIKELGMKNIPVRGHLKDLVREYSPEREGSKSFDIESHEDEVGRSYLKGASAAISAAGHHYKGREPLDWLKKTGENEDVALPEHAQKMKALPNYQKLLLERAAFARRSLKMREDIAKRFRSPREANALIEDLNHLYQRVRLSGGRTVSIMDVVENALKNTKTKYNSLAFPEHLNALRTVKGNDRESQYQGLANFLFCKGRALETKPVLDVKVTNKANRLRMGERSPEELGGVPDNHVLYDHGKFPTLFTSQWSQKHFGTKHGWVDPAMTPLVDEDAPASFARTKSFLGLHEDVVNSIFSRGMNRYLPGSVTEPVQTGTQEYLHQVPAITPDQTMLLSLDVLTDVDLLYKADKKDEGHPRPIKAMHRIFQLEDLDHLKGFSDDWVVSSWPKGERLIVDKKKTRIKVYDAKYDDFRLPNKVLEGVKAAYDSNFLVDCIWDDETLHIVDILASGDEKMEKMPTKDRVRHLRAQFAATEEVSIPAPINTKRVDSEGLERAVKDLLKEKGVKQVLFRDAESTYMLGEARHPKWVMLTPEKEIDVIVLESKDNLHRIGIGPLFEEDAKALGNRAVQYDDLYYMDVGSLHRSGLEEGQYVTVRAPSISRQTRNKYTLYSLNGARYVKDSEASATDSLETLEISSDSPNPNVPHKVRVKKGSVHIEFEEGHVVYDTEPHGHAFILKEGDYPSDYLLKLSQTQREYWSPLAAVLLRSEAESVKTKDSRKANVVPEPPANHTRKPKKVLKPGESLLKDPKITKELVTALEVIDGVLKEKITWTGPKGLGIDFATPVESPSGPTKLTEPKNLPDHDPAHRQEKGGDCWCGAKKGQECEQGLANKMEDCPKFSPPRKEERNKHIKIPVS